nr:MAG TPA: hypothetical protein [Caudoviricetes sp.]
MKTICFILYFPKSKVSVILPFNEARKNLYQSA